VGFAQPGIARFKTREPTTNVAEERGMRGIFMVESAALSRPPRAWFGSVGNDRYHNPSYGGEESDGGEFNGLLNGLEGAAIDVAVSAGSDEVTITLSLSQLQALGLRDPD